VFICIASCLGTTCAPLNNFADLFLRIIMIWALLSTGPPQIGLCIFILDISAVSDITWSGSGLSDLRHKQLRPNRIDLATFCLVMRRRQIPTIILTLSSGCNIVEGTYPRWTGRMVTGGRRDELPSSLVVSLLRVHSCADLFLIEKRSELISLSVSHSSRQYYLLARPRQEVSACSARSYHDHQSPWSRNRECGAKEKCCC